MHFNWFCHKYDNIINTSDIPEWYKISNYYYINYYFYVPLLDHGTL